MTGRWPGGGRAAARPVTGATRAATGGEGRGAPPPPPLVTLTPPLAGDLVIFTAGKPKFISKYIKERYIS